MRFWRLAFVIFVIHALLWQFAEQTILQTGERAVEMISGKPLTQRQKFDPSGVPVQLYRNQGLQYNPLFVAAQANRDYAQVEYPKYRQRFIVLTDWLLNNGIQKDSTLMFAYTFDYPKFGLKAPWYSALAQAVAGRALASRYELEGDPKWLQACLKSITALDEGSELTLREADNSLWYMEYPGASAPYVLNGMTGILLDLHRVWLITRDKKAEELFNRGYTALINKLPAFDTHGFSLYSIMGEPAGRNYHRMHIRQLRQLNLLRPHLLLQTYAKRWQGRDRWPVVVQLAVNPKPRRALAYSVSYFLMLIGVWGILALFMLLRKKKRLSV